MRAGMKVISEIVWRYEKEIENKRNIRMALYPSIKYVADDELY